MYIVLFILILVPIIPCIWVSITPYPKLEIVKNFLNIIAIMIFQLSIYPLIAFNEFIPGYTYTDRWFAYDGYYNSLSLE